METKAGDLEGLVKTSTEALKSDEKAPDASNCNKPSVVEDAPDPDEDDLDDLDGVYAQPSQVHKLILMSQICWMSFPRLSRIQMSRLQKLPDLVGPQPRLFTKITIAVMA
jgi:hypothetical protein